MLKFSKFFEARETFDNPSSYLGMVDPYRVVGGFYPIDISYVVKEEEKKEKDYAVYRNPVLFDEVDIAFLIQFHPEMVSRMLAWRYNEGLAYMVSKNAKDGTLIVDGKTYHNIRLLAKPLLDKLRKPISEELLSASSEEEAESVEDTGFHGLDFNSPKDFKIENKGDSRKEKYILPGYSGIQKAVADQVMQDWLTHCTDGTFGNYYSLVGKRLSRGRAPERVFLAANGMVYPSKQRVIPCYSVEEIEAIAQKYGLMLSVEAGPQNMAIVSYEGKKTIVPRLHPGKIFHNERFNLRALHRNIVEGVLEKAFQPRIASMSELPQPVGIPVEEALKEAAKQIKGTIYVKTDKEFRTVKEVSLSPLSETDGHPVTKIEGVMGERDADEAAQTLQSLYDKFSKTALKIIHPGVQVWRSARPELQREKAAKRSVQTVGGFTAQYGTAEKQPLSDDILRKLYGDEINLKDARKDYLTIIKIHVLGKTPYDGPVSEGISSAIEKASATHYGEAVKSALESIQSDLEADFYRYIQLFIGSPGFQKVVKNFSDLIQDKEEMEEDLIKKLIDIIKRKCYTFVAKCGQFAFPGQGVASRRSRYKQRTFSADAGDLDIGVGDSSKDKYGLTAADKSRSGEETSEKIYSGVVDGKVIWAADAAERYKRGESVAHSVEAAKSLAEANKARIKKQLQNIEEGQIQGQNDEIEAAQQNAEVARNNIDAFNMVLITSLAEQPSMSFDSAVARAKSAVGLSNYDPDFSDEEKTKIIDISKQLRSAPAPSAPVLPGATQKILPPSMIEPWKRDAELQFSGFFDLLRGTNYDGEKLYGAFQSKSESIMEKMPVDKRDQWVDVLASAMKSKPRNVVNDFYHKVIDYAKNNSSEVDREIITGLVKAYSSLGKGEMSA